MGDMDRRCRDCDACCVVVAVEEIAKPEQERCPHQGKHGKPGCAIYDERPTSCREWRCGWLEGFGTSKDRPDKGGIILDSTLTIGGPTVQAREVWAGAFHMPRARIAIEGFARQVAVVLMYRDGGRKLIGPPHIVARMIQAAHDGTAAAGGGFVPNCKHDKTLSQCRPCMEQGLAKQGRTNQ